MDKRLVKTLVFSGSILLVIAFMLASIGSVFDVVKGFFTIIRPLVIGGLIAFIINKPMGAFHTAYLKLYNKRLAKKHIAVGTPAYNKIRRRTQITALITAYGLFLIVIVSFICFVIPQFAESVTLFTDNLEDYYNNFTNLKIGNVPITEFDWYELLEEYEVFDAIQSKLMTLTEKIPDFIGTVFGFTFSVITVVVDVALGLILSIYILADKDHLKQQAVRLSNAILPDKVNGTVMRYTRTVSNSFSVFLSAQFVDSLILGMLCFITMSIIGFDYALLISTIIGLTNMLPIVGPLCGSIPCALILLLANPADAFWFLVMVIILQQIDSNIIYPKVVGENIGLPAIWVLIVIIIGGGLFGVPGILFGIPLASVLYNVASDFVAERNRIKQEKTMSVDSDADSDSFTERD